MSGPLDVLCVGSVTLDTIAVVPAIPGEDERVLADAFVIAIGGPATIAAIALARLGASVGFCGVVGDDLSGHDVLERLRAEGVDVDGVRVDADAATARSVILASVASGGRTIVTTRAPAPEAAEIPVERAAWVHADQTGFAPTRDAVATAGGAARLSVDAGNPIDTADWRGVELYAPAMRALTARYGAGEVPTLMQAAIDDGARTVVATDGPHGSWYHDGDQSGFVPGFSIDVVSSLGAGDVFHGALLAGLVRGLPLGEAVREANGAGALACRAVDGGSGIPDLQTLHDFLARRSDPTP